MRAGKWALGVAGAMASAAAAQVTGHAASWGQQGAGCTSPAGVAKPWLDPRQTPECRARFALQQFRTPAEKLRFLDPPRGDAPAGPARDVGALLGLPAITGADGPAGVVRDVGATALPSPLTIAASFDPAMATRYGDILGREFRAAGLATILGPAMDIARNWRFGRLSESFGEDPYLTARTVSPEIRAIQAHRVLATMKHYAVYTQEAGRVGDGPSGARPSVDNRLSERALREIYLPGFEAAVREGGVGAVMCSFPRVNGVYACENPHLMDILKREWRFDGHVGPDFPSAQRSITRAVLAGLDGGSFSPAAHNAGTTGERTLAEAFAAGAVPEARLDDLILRRLVPGFRIGIYDEAARRVDGDVSTPQARAEAAEIVAAGAVLLKNDRGILPFGPQVKSVAVIGVQATAGGRFVEQGSPHVTPRHLDPPLAAIERRAGPAIRIRHAPGTRTLGPLPAPAPGLFGAGWSADYAANPNLDFARPVASATVAQPFLDRQPDGVALPANNQWSVRYTGRFTPQAGGVHHFTLHGSGTARLYVDGRLRGRFDWADFADAIRADVPLAAGRPVEVRIEYSPRSALGPAKRDMFGLKMGLTLEYGQAGPDTLIADAVRAARAADVAVVFAGEQVGEGMDRAGLSLQGDQDALIAAVARANPRTVVVLNTGGPVAMPWLDRVAAVLETWLPGDAAGPATAALLWGDSEPGGRLPVTFPADETQGPATQPHQIPGLTDPRTGELDAAIFDEGVLVGYRWWDAKRQRPLFPFGHGLGYARFAIDPGTVEADGAGGAVVRTRVRNLSDRAGAEVVQVYVGQPSAAAAPPFELKGFLKVALQPGEAREVTIPLAADSFRHWDEDGAGWRTLAGPYRIGVGRSSRDMAWSASLSVGAR